MATYIVEACYYESELLYILRNKKEAIQAAKTEAENWRATGGNTPTYIEVSKWNYDEQAREPVGKVWL